MVLYRHYKGAVYEVLMDATHTEDSGALVIYRNVEKPEIIWARPHEMFHGCLPDGTKRFELVSE